MSRFVTRSFIIACDGKNCKEEFWNGPNNMPQYRAAARKAGWYSGVGNTDYCPECSKKMLAPRNADDE